VVINAHEHTHLSCVAVPILRCRRCEVISWEICLHVRTGSEEGNGRRPQRRRKSEAEEERGRGEENDKGKETTTTKKKKKESL
jgi:hypothetical protein